MYKTILKPLIDFILVVIGFLVLLPVFIILIILIKLKLGSPVLYKQERPGLHGKPFLLYKFRSMTDAKDRKDNLLPNEQRLTAFGKKLRASSLDELPSLLNVLKGEMSIVGPRPLRMRYLPLFSEKQHKRHLVKPGITGHAQVNGRSNINWDQKFKMDVYYVNHISFLLDCKIIIKTFSNVIRKKDTSPNEGFFEIPFDEYVKQKRNA